MDTVELVDESTGASAKVLVSLGFNCYSWCVQFGGESPAEELLWAEDGFQAGDKRPSGSGIPLLFPFPGRICGGKFEFEGRNYQVAREGDRPNAIHGFVYNRPWRIVAQSASHATAEFQASVEDPSILKQWPSDFRVKATYRLHGNQLDFEAEFTNCGVANLPWAFGTHAYFRLPLAGDSNVADTMLTAPVDGEWEMTDMLPTGTLANLPVDLDLSGGERLADRQFDTPYRIKSLSGKVATLVADPSSGRVVEQVFDSQEYPQLVIYTPGNREAVCLEPYTCVPDLFRLEGQGVATGLQVLAPGESKSTKIVLSAKP